ncbi:MAG: hypothetical protein J3Q66DRAFT_407789 [Benniella sp.]|nr:MAG: hypothetical protein J3Q66DRAFT_407789 [Benniella sp.]
MATSPDQQHVQTFPSSLTDEVVNIPTFSDKTGLRIVLWSDIQTGFKNADLFGMACVYRITPLRVPYHARVVFTDK